MPANRLCPPRNISNRDRIKKQTELKQYRNIVTTGIPFSHVVGTPFCILELMDTEHTYTSTSTVYN